MDTQVKNTFIEMLPSSVSPMPSPLASAPAKCASYFSLKDSLAEAAFSEESMAVKIGRARPRSKPDPLKCLSTNSMMSIPESPSCVSQPILIQKRVAESWASIPPTPAGLSDFGSTPTGTPYGASLLSPRWAVAPTVSMSASMLTATAMAPQTQAVLAPQPASRATLSLVDMIQSPKGATVTTFQMVQPSQQPSQLPPPPQYQATVSMPSVSMVNSAPPPQVLAPAFSSGNGYFQPGVSQGYAVSQMSQVIPPGAPPMIMAPAFAAGNMPAPPTFAAREIGRFQGQTLLQEDRSPPSAAVALGLMSAPSGPSTTATAVGTLKPTTTYVASSAPTASMVMAQPPIQATATTMGINSQPQRMVPPPPLNPAPMQVYSPTAVGPPTSAPTCMTPTSADSDMKVLLDMAVLSGNQKAVDALLRQAQLSGMTQNTIRSLMPPKAEPVVLGTSPTSR